MPKKINKPLGLSDPEIVTAGNFTVAVAAGKRRKACVGASGIAIADEGAEAFASDKGVSIAFGKKTIASGQHRSVSIAGTDAIANTGGTGGIAINLDVGPNPNNPVSVASGGEQCVAIGGGRTRVRVEDRSIAILMPEPDVSLNPRGAIRGGSNSLLIVGVPGSEGSFHWKIGIVGPETTVEINDKLLDPDEFYTVKPNGDFVAHRSLSKKSAAKKRSTAANKTYR